VANHEVWVAAKSGGFHLRLRDGRWHCDTTDEDLMTLLNRVFHEQLAINIKVF
jgi:CyaY protein